MRETDTERTITPAIANPRISLQKSLLGRIVFPALVNFREEGFGGFRAVPLPLTLDAAGETDPDNF